MPATRVGKLPEYENPPVTEVVCGVFFEPVKLLLPHFGLLWEKFRPEYPKFEEAIPLIRKITPSGETAPDPGDLAQIPLPRLWFVSGDDTCVVQVQRDCFLTNWRKVRPTDDYPRYEKVIGVYQEQLSRFIAFLEEQELPPIVPLQYDITYVNHVLHGEGWETVDDIGKVFPDIAWRSGSDRLLRDLESVNFRTSFGLPEGIGRLSVTIQTAERRSDKRRLLNLELTVRGKPRTASLDDLSSWFDVARGWIVRAFADLTSEELQKKQWRRTT